MKIYYSPYNMLVSNIFDKITEPNAVDAFEAVRSMEVGDLILFYIGMQHQDYEDGIYAFGEVVKEPYFFIDDPEHDCYGLRCVDVRIIDVNMKKPLIPGYKVLKFFVPLNRKHIIKEECYDELLKILAGGDI